jgi:hypothetical protein
MPMSTTPKYSTVQVYLLVLKTGQGVRVKKIAVLR